MKKYCFLPEDIRDRSGETRFRGDKLCLVVENPLAVCVYLLRPWLRGHAVQVVKFILRDEALIRFLVRSNFRPVYEIGSNPAL